MSENGIEEETPVEIGKVSEIEADQLYNWHTQGEALNEARMLRAMMERYDFTQMKLAKHLREELNVKITQAQISRLLSLLTLEPIFIEMLENKKMAHSTGILLAKLPPGNRMKILDDMKIDGRDRIFLHDVKQERRSIIITKDLLDLVENYGDGLDAPVDGRANRWWRDLSPEERGKIHDSYKQGDNVES